MGSCSISAPVSSSQPRCWLCGICGAELLMGHVSWAVWSHSKESGYIPGYIPCGTIHRSKHWVLGAQWMHLIFVNVSTKNDVKITAIWYVIKSVKYRCTFLFSYIFYNCHSPLITWASMPLIFMATGLFVWGLNNKDTSKALQCWSYPLITSWCYAGNPPVFFPHKEPPRQNILYMHPINERGCYTATSPLIGRGQTKNDPWLGQCLCC